MRALVLNNQLRFQGNAIYGMAGITTGAVLNIFKGKAKFMFSSLDGAGAAVLGAAALGWKV